MISDQLIRKELYVDTRIPTAESIRFVNQSNDSSYIHDQHQSDIRLIQSSIITITSIIMMRLISLLSSTPDNYQASTKR